MSRMVRGWRSRKTWPPGSAKKTRSPVFWNWRPWASKKNDCPKPRRTKPPMVPPPGLLSKMAFADLLAFVISEYPPSTPIPQSMAAAGWAPPSRSAAARTGRAREGLVIAWESPPADHIVPDRKTDGDGHGDGDGRMVVWGPRRRVQ